MPWCPDCNYEYRDDVTICADCGTQLVNRNLAPTYMDSSKQVLELAAICVFAPWLSYAAMALLAKVISVNPGLVSNLSKFPIVETLGASALALSAVYGYLRKLLVRVISIFEGWLLGGFIQFVICLILVALGQVPEPFKLIFMFPFYMIFSLIVLFVVGASAYVRSHWQSSHHPQV